MQGHVYLFRGSKTGWSGELSVKNADATYVGMGWQERAGYTLAGAGDLDGDGLDDFLIGCPEGGSRSVGLVYLMLGADIQWDEKFELRNSSASFEGGYLAGISLGAGGDFDGDLLDDIVIGDRYSSYLDKGRASLIFPDHNTPPRSITGLAVFSDAGLASPLKAMPLSETIYVRLTGDVGNSRKRDFAGVRLSTSTSDPGGFILRLHETGPSTGVYVGNFTLSSFSRHGNRVLNASLGELVTIASITDSGVSITLPVTDRPVFAPFPDEVFIEEDSSLIVQLSITKGVVNDWLHNTNASWIEWNATTLVLSGVPTNAHVGHFWVDVSVEDGYGIGSSIRLMVFDSNTPPEIMTKDVKEAFDDSPYVVDYNSSDD